MRQTLLASMGLVLLVCACSLPVGAGATSAPRVAEASVEVVPEQAVLTALPLRVKLPDRVHPGRVLAFYRTWGSPSWESLELTRAGQAWTGSVSCREVSTVTGPTRFAFLALDAKGSDVSAGDPSFWPNVETHVRYLPEGPQTLDGLVAELPCHDPADCPPDVIGCPAYSFKRSSCSTDRECGPGGHCAWDGYCGEISDFTGDTTGFDPTDEQLLAAAVRKVTTPRAYPPR
jgi:hypothetical protein